MNGVPQLVLALADPSADPVRLFRDSPDTTGLLVLAVFLAGLLILPALAVVRALRRRRLERLPMVLGDPRLILDQTAALVGLGASDRYLLTKVARRLQLPQPAAILLSPTLLVQAARAWKDSHRFSPTRQWGLRRLDHIARQIYGQSLADLVH